MAENKLSWTELRRALASRAGVSEKEANAFLSALTDELVVALKEDKQVKINGLGMFKLQAVAPRKSVNVVTGEEFTLEGYNKMVFLPEAGVKELIEGLEVGTPASDPIKKLGSQAEEIVDILGELGQSPVEPEPEPEPEPAVEEPAPAPEPVFVAPAPEPEPVYVAPAPEATPASEPAPEPFVFTSTPKKEKKEKKHHFLRDVLICVVILLLLLCGAYFFLREQLGGWIDSLLTSKPDSELVVPADSTAQGSGESIAATSQAEPEELTAEQILAEFLEASGEGEDEETPSEQLYEDLITIEPMHEASRLAWMAKRFYGAKIYWPYLYDANKDHISNPCLIEVGTPIRVPRLTPAQKDTTNAKTMATLERLRLEGEAACGH